MEGDQESNVLHVCLMILVLDIKGSRKALLSRPYYYFLNVQPVLKFTRAQCLCRMVIQKYLQNLVNWMCLL